MLADFLAHGCSARAYLRCMDREGIDAVVLYPSIGLFVPFLPALSPQRVRGRVPRVQRVDRRVLRDRPDAARRRRARPDRRRRARGAPRPRTRRALGLAGVMVRPNQLYGRDLGDRAYDPLYDALEEHGLMLVGARGARRAWARRSGATASESFALRHAMSHPMEQMAAMGSLMLLGALERHPALRVAFLESGTGWLPYWLARLDDHAEWMADTETAA